MREGGVFGEISESFLFCVVRAEVRFFFFNDTATTEIYTLSLHDALPICRPPGRGRPSGRRQLSPPPRSRRPCRGRPGRARPRPPRPGGAPSRRTGRARTAPRTPRPPRPRAGTSGWDRSWLPPWRIGSCRPASAGRGLRAWGSCPIPGPGPLGILGAMTGEDQLAAGREALAAGRWEEARAAFAAALADAETPEALDGLGVALWWLGDTQAAVAATEGAYAGFRRAGDAAGAAGAAVFLCSTWATNFDNHPVARG